MRGNLRVCPRFSVFLKYRGDFNVRTLLSQGYVNQRPVFILKPVADFFQQ